MYSSKCGAILKAHADGRTCRHNENTAAARSTRTATSISDPLQRDEDQSFYLNL